MLLGVALILFFGLLAGELCKRLGIPALIGMLLSGIVLGPHCLDLLDGSILAASADIRKIALIIILLRAGITLDLGDLKKVGRPALLMCFLPAALEILGMVIIAPLILGVSRLDAAIMGAVVGAVSPAVIVPRMIKLIETGWGTEKSIPQLILAGASADDVFVIVMFGAFTAAAKGGSVSAMTFVNIPLSVITGAVVGAAVGIVLAFLLCKAKLRDTAKVLIILPTAFFLSAAEDTLPSYIPFSSLIAVMFIGMLLKRRKPEMSVRLSAKLNKLWVGAEIFLFVLVGASVSIESALEYGLKAVVLILAVLVFRLLGVLICLTGTQLSARERLFCVIAYTPKATVQAAIGGVPLALGLECGGVVLTVSVLAILITAPLGAFGIDLSFKKLLTQKSV